MKVSVFRGAILFVACAMTAAVLAQAQQAPKDSKPAAAAAASAASAASASAPAVNQSATDSKDKAIKEASAQKAADDSAVFLRDVANAGFKPEHVRGTLMYCRTTTEIGSNFPVKTCYNEEQVRVKISEYQAERMEMQRKGTLPQFCNKTYAPQC
ncbi:MAG TPA: hypothetical protein VFA39_01990 [Steroidobacteraceae bacterium]|nr:hypothetical protein [Steroidobacteraceae bacterium]